MQRELETSKGVSNQLTAQLQGANAAADTGTKVLAQAHAEIQLLATSAEQLQHDVERLTSERVKHCYDAALNEP